VTNQVGANVPAPRRNLAEGDRGHHFVLRNVAFEGKRRDYELTPAGLKETASAGRLQ
jgi:hypothetical protein